jgi:hypothetical protein
MLAKLKAGLERRFPVQESLAFDQIETVPILYVQHIPLTGVIDCAASKGGLIRAYPHCALWRSR